MKCSAISFIIVFLVVATMMSTTNGRIEDTNQKDICRKNPLSSNCLNKKVKKPVGIFDSISFFLHNKKKKGRKKEFSTEASVPSSSVSPNVTTHHPDPVLQWRRVNKNIHNLENDACGIGLEPRILGGEYTMPGEFPWLARLRYKEKLTGNKIYACGGSLVSPKYILTAAHCLTRYGYKLLSVRLGEYNTKMYTMDCSENGITTNDFMEMDTCEPARDYDIKTIEVHKDYERFTLAHDIGLVQLQKSVTYTRYIQPICLPVGRYNHKINFGSDLMAAGWGMTEQSEGTDIPLKTRTPLMEMERCRHFIRRDLTPGQLCVGGADGGSTCEGDSGGPLVLTSVFYENDNTVEDVLYNSYNRTILVGIISGGGLQCKIEPTLFISVKSYLWWILTTIKT